jgi:TIR domain-containing protein
MDVFISWSGPRSEAAAQALRNWLPKIINAVKPWLSSSDIDKGARWGAEIAVKLELAKVGIICLTPSNLHSDWILFEAGALSKTLQNTSVCTFLIGLEPADIKGPLAQFQATRAVKEHVLQLLRTLNDALGQGALPESHISEAFEVWWPKLEDDLKKLPPDDSTSRPHRSERDLLEEILDYVRNQNRLPGFQITDEDRQKIIEGRAYKVLWGLQAGITSLSTSSSGDNLIIEAEVGRRGARHRITIPKNIALDDVAARTKAQMEPLVSASSKPQDEGSVKAPEQIDLPDEDEDEGSDEP